MLQQAIVRRNLLSKRAELMERIQRTTADIHRENAPLSRDLDDQAIERENDEVVEGIRESAQQEIACIDRALKRLEDGAYGTCTACGREIEASRLAVRPEADSCVGCASGHANNRRM
jgi:DnaK suppressor protein